MPEYFRYTAHVCSISTLLILTVADQESLEKDRKANWSPFVGYNHMLIHSLTGVNHINDLDGSQNASFPHMW
jgi:hypothetical protein